MSVEKTESVALNALREVSLISLAANLYGPIRRANCPYSSGKLSQPTLHFRRNVEATEVHVVTLSESVS
jgi:hypothetical protein